jgi:pyruvate,water dikinase
MGQGVELFPGYPVPPSAGDGPRPFSPDDDGRSWVLDFHFPQGLTPLGLSTFAVAYAEGTAAGAAIASAPATDGLSIRTVGPNLYVSPRPTDSATAAARAAEQTSASAARLAGFTDRWQATAASLDTALRELLADDGDPAELLERSAAHEARAWRVHFEEMYALVAGHLAYRDAMAGLGVPADVADSCLAGYPTRCSAADAALVDLAAAAGTAGCTGDDAVLGHPELRARFEALVAEHGLRAEGVADVTLASWADDPSQPLTRVCALARHHGEVTSHQGGDRAARRATAQSQARALASDPAAVDALVGAAEQANWIWWNEEHNAYIDLCASLPLRRAARRAGALLFADPDDAFLCSLDELVDALQGVRPPPSTDLLERRRQWLVEGRVARARLAAVVGPFDGHVPADPVIVEIFGLVPTSPAVPSELGGLGVSVGTARGPVRVVHSPDELDAVEPGEVLVCAATSPNWSYAFSLAAAVVCETGGPTTHAAIAAREYEVPCVVSAAGATRLLRDGEVVEVDGTTGTVRRT